MAITAISTTVRNSMCDAIVDAIDVSGTGTWQIWTTGFGTLLATLTFAATAFGAAVAGVATAATILDDVSADTGGTANRMRVRDGAAATVYEGTVSDTAGDLVMNTVAFTAGDVISISSATMTMPAA